MHIVAIDTYIAGEPYAVNLRNGDGQSFFFTVCILYKITMLYNQKAHTHGFTN